MNKGAFLVVLSHLHQENVGMRAAPVHVMGTLGHTTVKTSGYVFCSTQLPPSCPFWLEMAPLVTIFVFCSQNMPVMIDRALFTNHFR